MDILLLVLSHTGVFEQGTVMNIVFDEKESFEQERDGGYRQLIPIVYDYTDKQAAEDLFEQQLDLNLLLTQEEYDFHVTERKTPSEMRDSSLRKTEAQVMASKVVAI